MLHSRTFLYLAPAAIGLLLSATGCNDRNSPPTAAVEAPPEPATAPSRPTTQELTFGDRTTIALGGVPFELRAPAGWEVKTIGNENVLAGPTPYGSVEIGLTQRAMMKASYVDLMIVAAKKEANDDPTHRRSTDLKMLGGVRLLERRGPLRNATTTVTGDPGQPSTLISPTMMWKITAFVPRGSECDQFELNFHDFHEDQYDRDREFLQQILDTLKYNPSALVGG